MEARLGSIAWSIISDIHDATKNESPDRLRTNIEITRLAALNLIVKYRFSPEYLNLDTSDLYFTHISFESERSGIKSSNIQDAIHRIVESFSLHYAEKIRRMNLHDFIILLGQVHAIGSYNLPKSLNHGSDQHILGAFYTPKRIADYIVHLTMLPTLEKVTNTIKEHSSSSLEKFLNFRIIDPACGTGIFLVSVYQLLHDYAELARKKAQETGMSKNEVSNYFSDYSPRLYGVDLDLGALEVADLSIRLLESQYSEGLSDSHLNGCLKRGNSLISSAKSSRTGNHDFFETPHDYFPFEWAAEFPEVMHGENGGFNFIVMNPPYERLKPNLAEFLRGRLLSGNEQIQMSAFNTHKTRIREMSQYFRNSGEYNFATSYSLNTYQLFIERALQIAHKDGVIGCIVPSTILCDLSAQTLRTHLFLENQVRVIDCFPETSRLFPDVTQAVTILTVRKGGSTTDFGIGFNRSLTDALEKKRLVLDVKRIRKTMGPSLIVPQIDARGYEILDLIHKYPSLDSYSEISINRGELDLTTNQNLYSSKRTDVPLVRGSQISRYDLVLGRHEPKFADVKSLRTLLSSSRRVKHIDMKRIACQQVSNMNQRWRLKFAPIHSGSVLANSCNYIAYPQTKSNDIENYLLGILNSELLNWRFQVTNSNNHVSIKELRSLPLVPFIPENSYVKEICKAVQSYRLREIDSILPIEAYVLALYGFNHENAALLLQMRNCPKDELNLILQLFDSNTEN